MGSLLLLGEVNAQVSALKRMFTDKGIRITFPAFVRHTGGTALFTYMEALLGGDCGNGLFSDSAEI